MRNKRFRARWCLCVLAGFFALLAYFYIGDEEPPVVQAPPLPGMPVWPTTAAHPFLGG